MGILGDNKLHALLVELEDMGYWNQYPAIKALEREHLIRVVIEGGYYSRWEKVEADITIIVSR